MMFYGRISDVYMGVDHAGGDAHPVQVHERHGRRRCTRSAPRGWAGSTAFPGFRRSTSRAMPEISLFGLPTYYICAAALLACYLICRWILARSFGRVLIGIRENEARCELMGYNVPALQDCYLHHQRGDGRARRLPVRQLGRDRHAARVQPRTGRRSAHLGDRRRAGHADRPDPRCDRARLRQDPAG